MGSSGVIGPQDGVKQGSLLDQMGWLAEVCRFLGTGTNVNPDLVKAYLDTVSVKAATNATPSRNSWEKGGVQGHNK